MTIRSQLSERQHADAKTHLRSGSFTYYIIAVRLTGRLLHLETPTDQSLIYHASTASRGSKIRLHRLFVTLRFDATGHRRAVPFGYHHCIRGWYILHV